MVGRPEGSRKDLEAGELARQLAGLCDACGAALPPDLRCDACQPGRPAPAPPPVTEAAIRWVARRQLALQRLRAAVWGDLVH